MINHARTLLLNQPGEYLPVPGTSGAYIPPFRPISLDFELEAVDRVLFGNTATPATRTYYVDRLLSLLHASEFGLYLYDFDQRISYIPGQLTWADANLTSRVVRKSPYLDATLFNDPDVEAPYVTMDVTGVLQPGVYTEAGGHQLVRIGFVRNLQLDSMRSVVLLNGRSQPMVIPAAGQRMELLWKYPTYLTAPEYNEDDNYYQVVMHYHTEMTNAILPFSTDDMDDVNMFIEVKTQQNQVWHIPDGYIVSDSAGSSEYGPDYTPLIVNIYGTPDITSVRIYQTFIRQPEILFKMARRPSYSLSSVLSGVDSLPVSIKDRVFGRPALDKFKVFMNMYQQHPVALQRLAGFVLAYIYRLDAQHKELQAT